ncbi:unnamed protein product [Soboliphyme baturini]|uniref:BRCA-2_OB3 domain-containing protein n=1 Tax=Soboliphyme baturini TaxID=241478 RepID=A0A183IVJ1_9BILA|nr:unnamed protein product [Soboliphyme baturini]
MNERAYEAYMVKCIDEQSATIEKLVSQKFTACCQDENDNSANDDAELEQLKSFIVGSSDPSLITELISASQMKRVERRCSKVNEKKMESLRNEIEQTVAAVLKDNPLPKCTPLLTFLVHGASAVDQERGAAANLVVWRPDMENLVSKLQEGKKFRFHKMQLTCVRNSSELSTTSSSFVEELPIKVQPPPQVYIPRSVTTFDDLKNGTCVPVMGQVDIVGVVLDIALGERGCTAYLGDDLMKFVAVRFDNSLEFYGLNRVVTIGRSLAWANVVYQPSCNARVPHVSIYSLTQVTENPKELCLSAALDRLDAEIKIFPNYLAEAKKSLQGALKGYGSCSNPCLLPYIEEFRKPYVDFSHMPYSSVTLVTKASARAPYKPPFRYKAN